MSDTAKVVVGLAVFVALVAFPIWYTAVAGGEGERPELKLPETRVVLNAAPIVPYTLVRSGQPYPDLQRIVDDIRTVTPLVTVIDGPRLLEALGETRCLNNLLLGALAGLRVLPVDEEALERVVVARYGTQHRETNLRAIRLGVRSMSPDPAPDRQECEVPQ